MIVANFPLSLIDPPDPILRRIDKTSVPFLELLAQVKARNGSLQVPPARPRPNGRVQIIDGNMRLQCYIIAEISEMTLNIFEMDDAEYLAAQIQCNTNHADTNWIDLARHLDRLRLMTDTEMTHSELAARVGRSKAWVAKTLQLNHLKPHFKDMLRRDEIPVGNARWVAKLPYDEQLKYVDEARMMNTRQFETVARRALNDYRESIKQGNLTLGLADQLKPRMREFEVIVAEMKTPTHLPAMIAGAGITNPVDSAMLALKWAFRVDPATLDERREKMLIKESQRLNDAQRRADDRDLLRFQEQTGITT